jgi:hypothetical protein
VADERHVKGLSELQKTLDKIPVAMERNFLRGGLRRGMTSEVQPAAQSNIHSVSGQLAKGLKVGTRARGGRVTASMKATGPHAHVARWIEYGVAPHIINAKKGGALLFDSTLAKSVQHPGFKGIGFMRNALDSRAQAAVVATGEYIKSRLTKEGLDVAHVMIEGDE